MASARTVQLVYLARLRERFGKSGESYELPEHVNSVAALMRELASRGDAWAHELAPGRAFRVAVNHAVAHPDTPVAPGDEVAIFPPVTGG
ncbi:MAG TPA: molybdopterin converting factor subunit 1 [Casimicrobiaceae bacterium]|nr:molybdopterin converting factor subunit 1 [Casimicrobiaceae bacterium]